MRKFAPASLAIAGLLFASVGFGQSGDEKEARAIVEKGIKAIGGEAKLAKIKAMTWKEKGNYYGMGDALPYSSAYSVQWPSQFRMEVEGVFTIVLNNDKGWMKSGDATTDMDKNQLATQIESQRASWIASLIPLADKEFKLKSLGEAKVGEKKANVVQVSRKDYPDVKLYFAKDGGILVKSEFRTKAAEQEFKEVSQATYYSDYRDVDGLKLPFKVVVKRDDKVYVEANITEAKLPEKLDAKVFAKP